MSVLTIEHIGRLFSVVIEEQGKYKLLFIFLK